MQFVERVASDFDGVVTDVEREARTFIPAFQEGVAKALGVHFSDYRPLAKTAQRTIEADPGRFGWEYNGVIVAPATSDPYILERAKAKLVIAKLRQEKYLPPEQSFDDVLNTLYFSAYKKTGFAPVLTPKNISAYCGTNTMVSSSPTQILPT